MMATDREGGQESKRGASPGRRCNLLGTKEIQYPDHMKSDRYGNGAAVKIHVSLY